MTTPNIPTDNPMNALILTAMMQAIDQQSRDQLIKKALETLITSKDDPHRYGQKIASPLEAAFNYAVQKLADTIIKEMVENDPTIRDKVKSLCAQAAEKLFAQSDEISSAMARSMAQVIEKRY